MNNNPKAKDFRFIYANGMGVQFNGLEFMLAVGVKEDQSVENTTFLEEATIILSPSTAKLLGVIINKIIVSNEKITGIPIQVDETKINALDQAIAANEAIAAGAKDAASPGQSSTELAGPV